MFPLPSSRNLFDLVSLAISYKSQYRVPRYKTIQEISDDLSKLTWTEDPVGGKLDVVKHPTFMRKAMLKHPDYAGDCEDYAAYFCVALHKSGLLAKDINFCSVRWTGSDNKLVGHAVCVYTDIADGERYWVSNWNNCKPMKLEGKPYWEAVRSYLNRNPSDFNIIRTAYRYPVIDVKYDAPIFGFLNIDKRDLWDVFE